VKENKQYNINKEGSKTKHKRRASSSTTTTTTTATTKFFYLSH
jgi:hypothetical protein